MVDCSKRGTLSWTGTTFVTPQINVQTTFWLENLIGACPSTRVAVVATIGGNTAVINVSNSLPHICNGNGPAFLGATSNNVYYVYTWSPSTGLNTTSGASVLQVLLKLILFIL